MATPAEIQCLEQAYMALLRLPHSSVRLRSQHLLCKLRDAICDATGRKDQDVQEDYEARVYAQRFTDPSGE